MTFKSLLPLLFALALSAAAPARADEDAVRQRLAEDREIKASFSYGFNEVDHAIVIVSCTSERGRSAGSGFIAEMDGRPYLFTNQHVILGADRIRFKTAAGDTLKPLGVEVAAKRDIVRLPLGPEHTPLDVSSRPLKDEPIAVFGNSEGGGVATELYGRVSAISPDTIEVTADFVSGNSGSPILNTNQQVIGIASYVYWKTNEKDETEVQRFCYRLSDEEWAPVNWKNYNNTYGKQYRETEELIDSIVDVISTWYVRPSSRIDVEEINEPALRSWSQEHNAMVNKIEGMLDQGSCTQDELDRINRKIRVDLIDSANELSEVCRKRARTIRMILSKQRDMSGYLKEQYNGFAERLSTLSTGINAIALELEGFSYFHFKEE